ncbi:hypothetical protein QR680_006711 [Steinernema hermaphroditum]|uniref:Uncharacterized protein n=1 Tax=Steinernema hermaphroditum TaxID=289476 RepID=A0AA39LXI9_9BILA|nr:hypothetical protein QR680_006711 [Steinernema hermaphroditum]
MNHLPAVFYEKLFLVCYMKTVRSVQELSGPIGCFARAMTENSHDYVFMVKDNAVFAEELFLHDEHKFAEAVPVQRKYAKFVCVDLYYGNNEGPINANVLRHIGRRSEEYRLNLWSGAVSSEWLKWACSLKRLTVMSIYRIPTYSTLQLCQKLAEKSGFEQLTLGPEVLQEPLMGIMITVLCQRQFRILYIKNCTVLGGLLRFWTERPQMLVGKRLALLGHSAKAVGLLEGRLELCQMQESDSVVKEHLFFYRALLQKPSSLHRVNYPGAEDDNNIYISFECKARGPDDDESDELMMLRRTVDIRMLFA